MFIGLFYVIDLIYNCLLFLLLLYLWLVITPKSSKKLIMDKKEFEIREFLQQLRVLYIYPTYAVSLPYNFVNSSKKTEKRIENERNLSHNKHNGQLSRKSANRLKNTINWLLLSSESKWIYSKKLGKYQKFRLGFVTLTVPYSPNLPSDKFIVKHCLHNFLNYCVNVYGLKNYVWKAETQQNGAIHFHVITDVFIHYSDIRRVWNNQLLKKGVISDYVERTGDTNPNSTDVHKIKGVKQLGAYLATYMSKKEEGRRKPECRLWSCNYELSRNRNISVEYHPAQSKELLQDLYNSNVEFKELYSKPDSMGEKKVLGEIYFYKLEQLGRDIKNGVFELIKLRCSELRSRSLSYRLEFQGLRYNSGVPNEYQTSTKRVPNEYQTNQGILNLI